MKGCWACENPYPCAEHGDSPPDGYDFGGSGPDTNVTVIHWTKVAEGLYGYKLDKANLVMVTSVHPGSSPFQRQLVEEWWTAHNLFNWLVVRAEKST